MRKGPRRRVGGDILAAAAEEHVDAVRHLGVDVVLHESKPVAHMEQLPGRYRVPIVVRPLWNGGRRIDVELPIAHRDANESVGDALRHRPRDKRGVGRRVGAIAFGHQPAALDHNQSEADAHVRWLCAEPVERLLEPFAVAGCLASWPLIGGPLHVGILFGQGWHGSDGS